MKKLTINVECYHLDGNSPKPQILSTQGQWHTALILMLLKYVFEIHFLSVNDKSFPVYRLDYSIHQLYADVITK